MDAREIGQLVTQFSDGRAAGFFGEPAVNVVELNLALDQKFPEEFGTAGLAGRIADG